LTVAFVFVGVLDSVTTFAFDNVLDSEFEDGLDLIEFVTVDFLINTLRTSSEVRVFSSTDVEDLDLAIFVSLDIDFCLVVDLLSDSFLFCGDLVSIALAFVSSDGFVLSSAALDSNSAFIFASAFALASAFDFTSISAAFFCS
jgi:hypothetical protein